MSVRDASPVAGVSRQHLLDFLFDAVEAIVVVDSTGRFSFASASAARLLGLRAEDLLGRPVSEVFLPDTCRRLRQIQAGVVAAGRVLRYEEELHTTAGSASFLLSAGPLRDEDGTLVGVAFKANDLSRRVAVEAALRRSEAGFRLLAENARDLIYRYRFHPTPAFEYVSPSSTRMTGYTPAEHYANPGLGFDIVHPDDRARLAALVSGDEPMPERLLLRWIAKDGRVVWTEQQNVLVHDHTGRLVAIEGVARDVTRQQLAAIERDGLVDRLYAEIVERVRAEEEARLAQTETERVLASLSALLIELDPSGRIVRWNNVAEEVLGSSASAMVGRSLSACGAWEWGPLEEAIGTAGRERRTIEIDDVTYRGASGHTGVLRVAVSPVDGSATRQGADSTAGVVLLAVDVTERRAIERQLREGDTLRAIGMLAAGAAHEINTPIQWVSSNLEFVREGLEALGALIDDDGRVETGGDPASGCRPMRAGDLRLELNVALSESVQGLERVAAIVRAMQEFSHPGGGGRRHSDLNHQIETALTLTRGGWAEVADVTTRLDPDLPAVDVLPGDLEQVWVHLLTNAAQAVTDRVEQAGGRGRILVETRRVDDTIEVRIDDTGSGIDASVRPRIFDPFFTTRPAGQGTGLGLTIAQAAIVDRHGGTIDVVSEVGRGTTVVVTLPLAPKPWPTRRRPATASVPAKA